MKWMIIVLLCCMCTYSFAHKSNDQTATDQYLRDSLDYIDLKKNVQSVIDLHLISEYLREHKYRKFRELAIELRAPFVVGFKHVIPKGERVFENGKIISETFIDESIKTEIEYVYNFHGRLFEKIERKRNLKQRAKWPATFMTVYRYDWEGRMSEEKTTNAHTRETVAQVFYRYDNTTGMLTGKTSKHKNGKSYIESYKNGKIKKSQHFVKGVLTTSYAYDYDEEGRLIKEKIDYAKPDQNDPVTSQTNYYLYDSYGYLTQKEYKKEYLQEEAITGCIEYFYDEFGNLTDPDFIYEYDQVGTWVIKAERNNPENVERMDYTYW